MGLLARALGKFCRSRATGAEGAPERNAYNPSLEPVPRPVLTPPESGDGINMDDPTKHEIAVISLGNARGDACARDIGFFLLPASLACEDQDKELRPCASI